MPLIEDPKIIADFPKFITNAVADQIKQADTKAVGVLGVLGILTGALLTRLNSIKSVAGADDPVWVLIFVVSFIMILLSLKSIILVVYPRLSKKGSDSLTYFEDINSINREEYVKRARNLDVDGIINETYSNAYSLARIASKKYNALRRGMIITGITIIWTIGVLLFS